jgi:RIO kinase 1
VKIKITKKVFNQKVGFEFSKNRRQFDEYKQDRNSNTNNRLREITVTKASNQLLATGKIEKIISVIGAGKEATVLLAQEKKTDEMICAKVYRYYTSTIRKRLQGTRHITKEMMASIAAKQEYWNLYELYKTNIPVPKPRYLLNNIMTMDFIELEDDSLVPAPVLSDVNISDIDDPENILYEAIDIIARMFLEGKMIHGDYSNDNLMITERGLVTMDVSQSVLYNQKTFIDTPTRLRIDKAVNFLLADITNLNKGFYKYRISIDPKEVCQNIVKDLPENLQNYLEEANSILALSGFVSERYTAKEMEREEIFQRRSKKKYQKKKR